MLQGRNGFTLLELMVTLVIFTILALLAAPSFTNFNQSNHVSEFAQDLLYNLQFARSLAIENNENVYVTFTSNATTPSSPWCYGINLGSACTCGTPSSCSNGVFTDPSPPDVVLAIPTLTGGSLIFEGTRGATANGASGTITFNFYPASSTSSAGPTMGLDVTLLGNMSLCSSTISGYSAC